RTASANAAHCVDKGSMDKGWGHAHVKEKTMPGATRLGPRTAHGTGGSSGQNHPPVIRESGG
ncbi:MAG TPA: hypothetical protein DDW22_00825, partial [Prevotellaceae bacterium]|nr:hypothetical protein [Prevotellaceae bacterium]